MLCLILSRIYNCTKPGNRRINHQLDQNYGRNFSFWGVKLKKLKFPLKKSGFRRFPRKISVFLMLYFVTELFLSKSAPCPQMTSMTRISELVFAHLFQLHISIQLHKL